MIDAAKTAVEIAVNKGSSYADARYENRVLFQVNIENSQVSSLTENKKKGILATVKCAG